MNFTVRWVPNGPEMAVGCRTFAEVVTLAQELIAIGKASDIKVSRDGEDLDVNSILARIEGNPRAVTEGGDCV